MLPVVAMPCSKQTTTTNGLEYETEWSTSGTGNFSATLNILNPTYEPSIADINNGSVTLTLRAKADQPWTQTTLFKVLYLRSPKSL